MSFVSGFLCCSDSEETLNHVTDHRSACWLTAVHHLHQIDDGVEGSKADAALLVFSKLHQFRKQLSPGVVHPKGTENIVSLIMPGLLICVWFNSVFGGVYPVALAMLSSWRHIQARTSNSTSWHKERTSGSSSFFILARKTCVSVTPGALTTKQGMV